MSDLKTAWNAFASFGTSAQTEMDNSHFSKMLRECGIIDGKTFTGTDADLLFNKAKAKGARKLSLDAFIATGMPEIAKKKKMSEDAVKEAVASKGPASSGTKAEDVALADKDNFTGVAKEGGPTTVDKEKQGLAALTDRDNKADVRGATHAHEAEKGPARRKSSSAAAPAEAPAPEAEKGPARRKSSSAAAPAEAPAPEAEKGPARRKSSSAAAPAEAPAKGSEDLKATFIAFASFGSASPVNEMDGAKFTKMLKDSKILDGKVLTGTDVDMIFTKAKAKAARKITFAEFKDKCVPELATKKKVTPDDIIAKIQAASPASSGTKAEAVALADKDNFSGVAKEGGPTTVDKEKQGLAGLTDRDNKADVRGAATGKSAKPAPKK